MAKIYARFNPWTNRFAENDEDWSDPQQREDDGLQTGEDVSDHRVLAESPINAATLATDFYEFSDLEHRDDRLHETGYARNADPEAGLEAYFVDEGGLDEFDAIFGDFDEGYSKKRKAA